jgi:AMP deaminase
LSAIYTNIQKVLDLRHKYLRVSLQRHGDNPKDDPSWNIYPPPPPPVWVEETRSTGQDGTEMNETSAAEKSFWAGNERPRQEKHRKPGEDIGEDFVFEEVEIPGADEMEFRMDDKGVYQVYENKKGKQISVFIVCKTGANCPL